MYSTFCHTLTHWCQEQKQPIPSIVAATKYATPEQIQHIVREGATCLGENKLQSAQEKQALPAIAALPVSWHFIGHLQSNKAAAAIRHFDCIQSGDRLSLLETLNTHAGLQGKRQDILIQVNPAKEASKHGFFIEEVYRQSDALFSFPNLQVLGIMAMAPYDEDPEAVRGYFRETARLFQMLRGVHPEMHVLSMGMSHDYRVAIEEGASMIRIGSLLFEGAKQ